MNSDAAVGRVMRALAQIVHVKSGWMRMVAGDVNNPLAEQLPPLTAHAAAVEADRCLYCFDAPCTHACPRTSTFRASSRKSPQKTCGAQRRPFSLRTCWAQRVRGFARCRSCAREHVFWEAITSPLRLGACNALPWTARAIATFDRKPRPRPPANRSRSSVQGRGTFVRRRTGQARPCRDAF